MSTNSVNTVVENPNFNTPTSTAASNLITPTSAAASEGGSTHGRQRRGSYTLDQPSPVLLAYLSRYGAVEEPCSPFNPTSSLAIDNLPKSPASTPEDRRRHLDTYLSDLSQPPNLTSKTPSPTKIMKCDQDDIDSEVVFKATATQQHFGNTVSSKVQPSSYSVSSENELEGGEYSGSVVKEACNVPIETDHVNLAAEEGSNDREVEHTISSQVPSLPRDQECPLEKVDDSNTQPCSLDLDQDESITVKEDASEDGTLSSQIHQLAEIVRKDSENIQRRVSMMQLQNGVGGQEDCQESYHSLEVSSSSLQESMSIQLPPSVQKESCSELDETSRDW